MLDRHDADARNLLTNRGAFGIWSVGDWANGGCVAFTDLGFDPASTPTLVLVDDDPAGSAGKTFHPFSYNRDVDPAEECPAV